jgi:uncharacterized protein YbaR (Trm112 family)
MKRATNSIAQVRIVTSKAWKGIGWPKKTSVHPDERVKGRAVCSESSRQVPSFTVPEDLQLQGRAMQIESWLAVLQCPITGSGLRCASKEELTLLRTVQQRKTLLNQLGRSCSYPLEEGLVDLEGRWFYPIVHGIPWMIAEEAFDLKKHSS